MSRLREPATARAHRAAARRRVGRTVGRAHNRDGTMIGINWPGTHGAHRGSRATPTLTTVPDSEVRLAVRICRGHRDGA